MKKSATKPPPAPKHIGRPRTITPELERRVLESIASGTSVKEACALAGVSFASYNRKWVADEAFRNRCARAYLHGTIFYLSNAEHRLEAASSKDIAVAREIAHHARWRAARLIPAFSEKLAIGVTDEAGFFGGKPAPAEPEIDKDDPKQSWALKPFGEWDAQERTEAGKQLAFESALYAKRLRDLGVDEAFVDGFFQLGQRLGLSIMHPEQAALVPLALHAPAVPGVLPPEPDRPGSPLDGVDADLRADIERMQ